MNENQETRLSKLEGIVEGIGKQVTDFIASQNDRDRVLFKKLDEAKDMSRPNVANLIAMGVGIIMFLGALGGLTGFFVIREWDRFDTSLIGLDTKLQREQILVAANTEERVMSVRAESLSHDEALRREIKAVHDEVQDLKQFNADQVRAELQELRERRMKDSHSP